MRSWKSTVWGQKISFARILAILQQKDNYIAAQIYQVLRNRCPIINQAIFSRSQFCNNGSNNSWTFQNETINSSWSFVMVMKTDTLLWTPGTKPIKYIYSMQEFKHFYWLFHLERVKFTEHFQLVDRGQVRMWLVLLGLKLYRIWSDELDLSSATWVCLDEAF